MLLQHDIFAVVNIV